MEKKKNLTPVLIVAFLLVGAMAAGVVAGVLRPERPELLQGQAEATDYRLSCKVPARVKELRVGEGDRVRRGDTLALLTAPDMEAKLRQAEAARAATGAMEGKAQRGTRDEQVAQAYELWQKSRADLTVAEKNYGRTRRLFNEGVVAAQRLDEAQARRDAAAAAERAARAQYEMAVNGTRSEDKAAARAQTARAGGAVEEVESYLRETVLTAPADGYVTEIFPEVGELVGSGAPVMNVIAADDVWFTFNLREDKLPQFATGRETDVFLPALGKRVRGRVTRIKEVGTFAAWKPTRALGGFDLKTFEVRVRPLRPQEVRGVRSGMSAVMEAEAASRAGV